MELGVHATAQIHPTAVVDRGSQSNLSRATVSRLVRLAVGDPLPLLGQLAPFHREFRATCLPVTRLGGIVEIIQELAMRSHNAPFAPRTCIEFIINSINALRDLVDARSRMIIRRLPSTCHRLKFREPGGEQSLYLRALLVAQVTLQKGSVMSDVHLDDGMAFWHRHGS